MADILTDEQMNGGTATATATRSAVPAVPRTAIPAQPAILSDADMGITGPASPPILSDAEMGSTAPSMPRGSAPPILADSQMNTPPMQVPTPAIPTAAPMPTLASTAVPGAELTAQGINLAGVTKNALIHTRNTLGRDLTPAEVENVTRQVANSSPITPHEYEVQQAVAGSNTATGVSGFAKSMAKGAMQGAVSLAQGAETLVRNYSVMGKAASMMGAQQMFSPEKVASIQHRMDTTIPTADTLPNTVANVGGHMLPGLAGAALTGGAAAIPTFTAMGGVEGVAAAQNEIHQQRQLGHEVSALQEHAATIGYGIANAIVSALGGKALNVAGTAPSTIGRIADKALAGGLTGVLQKGGENLIAKGTFDPDRPITEGTGTAFVGGMAGAGLFGVGEEFFRDRSGRTYRTFKSRNGTTYTTDDPNARNPFDGPDDPAPSSGGRGASTANPRPSMNAEALHRQELGLPADGPLTYEQVRTAFRKRVRETHPDLSDSPDAAAAFQRVVQAGEYLDGLYPQPAPRPTQEQRPGAEPSPAPQRPVSPAQPMTDAEMAAPPRQPARKPAPTAKSRPMTDAEMVAKATPSRSPERPQDFSPAVAPTAAPTEASPALPAQQPATGAEAVRPTDLVGNSTPRPATAGPVQRATPVTRGYELAESHVSDMLDGPLSGVLHPGERANVSSMWRHIQAEMSDRPDPRSSPELIREAMQIISDTHVIANARLSGRAVARPSEDLDEGEPSPKLNPPAASGKSLPDANRRPLRQPPQRTLPQDMQRAVDLYGRDRSSNAKIEQYIERRIEKYIDEGTSREDKLDRIFEILNDKSDHYAMINSPLVHRMESMASELMTDAEHGLDEDSAFKSPAGLSPAQSKSQPPAALTDAQMEQQPAPKRDIIESEQPNEPRRQTASDSAVQEDGQPGDGSLGRDGAGVLEDQPTRSRGRTSERGTADDIPDSGAGERSRDVRDPDRRGDGPAGGAGDRPEGVHPDRPARADQPAGAGRGSGESDRRVSDVARIQREEPSAHTPASAGNFIITDPAALHAGGLKQKFTNNVTAIQTLRKIESEGRTATPEEQSALAKFVGWGAMPGAFNKYTTDAGEWSAQRDEIATLLSPEEFAAAAKSTLNAHYTSGQVVQGMWEMVKRLGFDGRGRILEPSMGVGNFFGLLPPEFRSAALTGVELDQLTGRIAKHLYPNANVLVHGYEDLKTPAGFFDLAISNVPFGDFRVHDKAYNKFRASIHDYFFLKSLDQVRPGGAVMFITSTGTLDKLDLRIRTELAKKADLVTAMRLPEGAFAKNAGTAVVTDLIILKRLPDGAAPSGPAWTNIKTVPDPDGGKAIPINEYFVEHPEQVLGTVDRKSRMYGSGQPHVSMTSDFEQRWKDAIARVPEGVYEPRATPQRLTRPASIAPSTVKEGGYVREGGKIQRKEQGELVEVTLTPKQQKIIEGMLKVRDALRETINAQIEAHTEQQIKAARAKLNREYDAFVKQHGPLNKPENKKAFDQDPDAPVILALEKWNPKTKTATKSDAFSKNTVRGTERPTKADNPAEAVGISLNESARIDVDRIASLVGSTPDATEKMLVAEGLAYLDPAEGWQSSEQYLAGNVRRKLLEAKQAAALDAKYRPNVTALDKVQPADVPYDEIDARLGVPWVGPEDVSQFAADQFGTDAGAFSLKYLPTSGEWLADYTSRGSRLRGTPNDSQILGTGRAGFMDVLEAALNNKVITIRDKIGSNPDQYAINKEESAAANAKVEDLQQRFRDWIWQDDARRSRLHRYYNDTFNNIAPVRYNGSHLRFPGMSPTFNGSPLVLRDHQRNAIWRTIVKGTALYAHEVGTGKTITMVASAMELRRLGLSRKPAIAVLKSTLPGFVKEARELYPTAKILAVDQFEAKNRKQVISQIATGDWDLVILTHDHVDMLPMKKETQSAFIQRELDELESVIREAQEADTGSRGRAKSGNRLVKKLEKSKARLETRLKEALDSKQDDAVTFEETGIDQLFVDEAHKYKSLPVYTKQDRIKGIPTSRSDRATQMWMRTRWLQEMNNGRGVVMATGTPITNTMAELYTMMRYLQGRDLDERGISAFDAWARNFGIITTRMEYGVTGEYAPVSRFSRFVNLPELGRIAGQVIDVKRAKDMPTLVRPKRKDQVVTVPMSASQRNYLQEIKARAIEAKKKKPGEPGDNMLSISTDARKSALDMRLVEPNASAADSTKLAKVTANVLEIWREDPTRTQMIFSDIGIHPTKWGYSPFEEITQRLVQGGIPAEKIINFSTLTDAQKRTASERLKKGEALIGLGSTDKMGTGVNAQDHLYALHHIDVPWLPGSVEQRDGRGWRQGNRHKQISIFRYTTEGSFDTFMWQAIDSKSRFIKQFVDSMASGESTERSVKDEDTEELSAAQIMAVTSGNPLLLDKINLDRDVSELEAGSRRHERNALRLKDTAVQLQRRIEEVQEDVTGYSGDLKAIQAAPDTAGDAFEIEIGGETYSDREEANAALVDRTNFGDWAQVGQFRGLPLYSRRALGSEPETRLGSHIRAGMSISSIEHAARPSTVEGIIQRLNGRIAQYQKDINAAKDESARAYPKAVELKQKKSELDAVVAKMSAESKPETSAEGEASDSSEPNRRAMRGGRHAGAVYIGWLDPVFEAGSTAVGAGTAAARGFVNLAVRDLMDRVRDKGTPTAILAADLAEKAVNTAKAAAGTISKHRDAALTITGAGLSPSRHKAQISLQRVEYPAGKQYGIARIIAAVEGKIPTAQLSRAEKETVEAIQHLTDVTGRGYRANGIQQYNHRTSQWQTFNYIPGGKIFIRLHTPEMMDAISQGTGKVWTAAIDAVDEMNPTMGRKAVEEIFNQMHADMVGDGPAGSFTRVNAEFTREIKNVPSHVLIDGREIPLLETNPYSYARRLSDHYAARVGFVKHFGQELKASSTIAALKQAYAKENGETDSLVDLTRALNGIPVERPMMDPGGDPARVIRIANSLLTVVKASMLSASTIQNVAEPLGNLQASSDGLDLFRAAARLIRSPRATIVALEQLGAVNMNPADLAWNPSRPLASLSRILREASSRIFGHHFINELQEKMAGALALEKVERMQAGKGTNGDIYDLRALGMPLDKARRIAKGLGTPAEYNEVIRRIPPSLVGSPMGAAERTRMSHNRVYRAAIAFEGYAQMKVRGFLRNATAYADIAHKTRGGIDDPMLFFRANVKMGRYLAGTTASGALGYFLMALATGGVAGLAIAWNEAKDRPLKFLRDSFLYTMFAGPYGAVIRSASGSRPLGQTLVRATLPGFLLAETIDAFMGNGTYAGMTRLERMMHIAAQLAPVNRVATQAAAAMGFGEENQQLNVAIRAYWRWKLESSPGASFNLKSKDEDQQAFGLAMRRAYNKMRSGDTPGMQEALANAIGNKGDKSAAQSILARRLLWNLSPEDLISLRNRIGEGAMQQLQAHDNLLLAWASSLGTPEQQQTESAVSSKDVAGAVGPNSERIASRITGSTKPNWQQDEMLNQAGIAPPPDLQLNRELTQLRKVKESSDTAMRESASLSRQAAVAERGGDRQKAMDLRKQAVSLRKESTILPADVSRLQRLEQVKTSINTIRKQIDDGNISREAGEKRIASLLQMVTSKQAA